MYIFYKRINHKYETCENCGKEGTRIRVVRWVWPGQAAYVAGHNAYAREYCSLKCAKQGEKYSDAEWVRVRKNTIAEINQMGYPA